MKYLSKNEDACIKCHACEDACSETFHKEADRSKSAIQINEPEDTDKDWVINVCDQCGECIDICSEEALYRAKNGVVMLNKNKCVACLMCVGFCPTLSMVSHEELDEPFKCTACGVCEKVCPTEAIEVAEGDTATADA